MKKMKLIHEMYNWWKKMGYNKIFSDSEMEVDNEPMLGFPDKIDYALLAMFYAYPDMCSSIAQLLKVRP
ncbi:unnamed protein product, partial [marine sediment metagenome]